MKDETNPLLLIIRFLDKPDDKTLQSAVDSYRKFSKANDAYFLQISQIWELSSKAERLAGLNQAQSLKSFKNKLKKKLPTKSSFFWFANIAATFLVISIGYLLLTKNVKMEYNTKTTSEHLDSIALTDGSIIKLAENTEIKYPTKFASNERKILLIKGQAFFKIAKNPDKPFKILINESVVTVLGTSFNIKKALGEIKLGVKTGKVRFNPFPNGNDAILTAGQGLVYDIVKREFNASPSQNADAWLTKKLVFVDTPLENVCKELSNYYHIEIKLIHNRSSVKKLNATFQNQSLDEVLEVLNNMYNLKINREKKQINLIMLSAN